MILLPRLYAIVDPAFFSTSKEVVAFSEELLAGGCTLLQYRNKLGNARLMLDQALLLRRHSRAGVPAPHVQGPYELKLILNDRADFCLAAEFDGLQCGQNKLPPRCIG